MNAVEAWLGTLPGNPYANVRQPIVHTLNLAHMMPVSAVWAGPERNTHLAAPPLMIAETRGTTPFRLDLHVGDVGHTLVVGPTGAGKSVLLATLALQFRRFIGAQVVLFDKGRSARAAALAMNGVALDLALDGDIAFQPLRDIDRARPNWRLRSIGCSACITNEARHRHARAQGQHLDGAAEPRVGTERPNARSLASPFWCSPTH